MPKSVNTDFCLANCNSLITNSLKMFERLKMTKIFCVRELMELIFFQKKWRPLKAIEWQQLVWFITMRKTSTLYCPKLAQYYKVLSKFSLQSLVGRSFDWGIITLVPWRWFCKVLWPSKHQNTSLFWLTLFISVAKMFWKELITCSAMFNKSYHLLRITQRSKV